MPYFTTVEFRSYMPDMNDDAKYPDVRVELARDAVEDLIERVCGTSFISRTITETLDGSDAIVLSSPYVQSITSVTVDGVLETGYTYTSKAGVLRRRSTGTYVDSPWLGGSDNVTVVYVAGYSTTCPDDLKLAAMEATRDKVMRLAETSGAQSSRATSITDGLGGTTQFLVAGDKHPTGLPAVDAVIMGWADKVRVFGFA